MKRGLVVYESMFGDNQRIARAIAAGLSDALPSNALEVGEATWMVGPDVALLVVGGPNHATAMTRPSTREGAANKSDRPIISARGGLREWFEGLPPAYPGARAAAFDTRMTHPKAVTWMDHAARSEEKLLRAHGFDLIAPAEHFFVQDVTGPLVEGEEARARRWGQTLGALCTVEETTSRS